MKLCVIIVNTLQADINLTRGLHLLTIPLGWPSANNLDSGAGPDPGVGLESGAGLISDLVRSPYTKVFSLL